MLENLKVNLRQNIAPLGLIAGLFLILLIAARQSEPTKLLETTRAPRPATDVIRQPTRAGVASDPAIRPTQVVTAAVPAMGPAMPAGRPAVPTATPASDAILDQPETAPVVPWQARQILGYSAQGRPIEAHRLGTGPNWFVVLGAIHGSHECNTYGLVSALLAELSQSTIEINGGTQHQMPEDAHHQIPANVTLFIVPVVNPDGCALDNRLNARGVDLNRNWNTNDWISDASGPTGVIAGSGGPYPLSEPETLALSRWLSNLQAESPTGTVHIISYHSAVPPTGLVLPAYTPDGQPDPRSMAMAERYATVTGYSFSVTWVGNYVITGQLIHWARLKGMAAIDVELPDRNAADTIPFGWPATHIETNLAALLAVLGQITR